MTPTHASHYDLGGIRKLPEHSCPPWEAGTAAWHQGTVGLDFVELSQSVNNLGKGMVQVNLRLSRILDLVEGQRQSGSGSTDVLEVVFDLLDAFDGSLGLAAGHEGNGREASGRRWWWFGRGARRVVDREVDSSQRGLRLAQEHALDRLRAMGLEPVTRSGPCDLQVHRVVERLVTRDSRLADTLASTHRGGWVRRCGERVDLLRPAHVSVYVLEERS